VLFEKGKIHVIISYSKVELQNIGLGRALRLQSLRSVMTVTLIISYMIDQERIFKLNPRVDG